MSMSKKHFIRLADYLRDTEGYCEPFTDRQLEHLANFCHSQNYAFMRKRWLGYIKGENGPCGGSVKIATSVKPVVKAKAAAGHV